MANIVQGLFGPSASQIGQERYDTGYAQDVKAVQLDPLQQANLALRQGGRGIAQGAIAPMLGVQDVELQAQSIATQLASQFDLSSPSGMTKFAQALREKAQETGLTTLNGFSDRAGQRALSMAKTAGEISKTEKETRLMGREFENLGVEGNPELVQKAVVDKDGNIIANVGSPMSRYTSKSNLNVDLKLADFAAQRRDQFLKEAKPLIDQGANIEQGITLLKTNSPFSEAAFANTVVGAFGGEKQKAKAEIDRLINTGSLDERITNSLSKFATGKVSEMTNEDRLNVLTAVGGDVKRRYNAKAESTRKATARVKGLEDQTDYVAPNYEDTVGGGAARGQKAYTIGETFNHPKFGVLKVTKVDGAGNPVEVVDSKGNIGNPAQGAK